MSLFPKFPEDRWRELLGAMLLILTVFLFFSLVTDEYQGRIQRPLDTMGDVYNLCGRPGAYAAGFSYVVLGNAAHVLYFVTCVWALILFTHRPLDRFPARLAGLVVLTGSVGGLLHLNVAHMTEGGMPGGMLGSLVGGKLLSTFGVVGANVIIAGLAAIGILLATEFLFFRAFRKLPVMGVLMLRLSTAVWRWTYALVAELAQYEHDRRRSFKKRAQELLSERAAARDEEDEEQAPLPAITDDSRAQRLGKIRIQTTSGRTDDVEPDLDEEDEPEEEAVSEADVLPPVPQVDEATEAPLLPGLVLNLGEDQTPPPASAPLPRRKRMARRKTLVDEELPPDYEYPRRFTKPSLDLLDEPEQAHVDEKVAERLRRTSLLVEKALATHGVEARVVEVTRGPTITRYELEPAPGIKVSRFHSLADDLALALKAQRVRVEAPIPGKGRIGIELPNAERDPVLLRELIESTQFRRENARGHLALPLGKDIAGEVVTADLTSMPHLLIAGATGSGKSVCTKALLASLLFKHTPEEVQLVLIDPKMVEFSFFNDIPHLITPVVIDAKKAAAALNWLVAEMEERYRLFAQLRVRNIESYNESVENGEIEISGGEDGEDLEAMSAVRKLPYIVCVIDELADLMMLARAEVEDAIMRLAQLARAVGIHLILATQRPSVNVITGVIKANFPVRIAFQVSSKVDSRCILDAIGAERLIGMGDMLYLPAGKATPTRIQGAFVSDSEMNALIAYLKTQAPPQYRDEIANFGKTADELEALADEDDELLDEAVQVVLSTGQASISMVQRKLRVGYTRAARLIDMMEVRGIVGPHVGSKAREILVSSPRADKKSA